MSKVKQYSLKTTSSAPPSRYLINYEEELNESQLDAVRSIHGPQLVIAGAGSGKTRTLIYRVAYLVENGVDPKSILLLTFTRKAAQEMMRRAAQILDDRCREIQGGTFHGFANLTLRRYAGQLGYNREFTIADRSDAEDMVNLLRTQLGYASKDKRFPKKGTILNVISKSANTGQSYSDILSEEYPQFIEEDANIRHLAEQYRAYKKTRSIMDYDDLLLNHLKLLEEFPQVREKLSQTYQFIMIDEFQDTNLIQAKIALLLASEHNNIVAVGDDSQSIYSFRGAVFRNIMEFPNHFSKCKITTLEKNYRSTQPILSFTNRVIEAAQEKYSKVLYSDIISEQKPVFIRATSFEEQAEFVAQRVLDLREEGIQLDHIAVLFRAGWHSNELEIELSGRNIPFVKYGGLKFVEAAHVKDAVSLLRVIHNPRDAISWYRLLLLIDGIGPKTAERIVQHVVEDGRGHQGLIDPLFAKHKFSAEIGKLHRTIDTVITSAMAPGDAATQATEFYLPLLRSNYEDFQKRLDDLTSFTRIASRYANMREFLDDISLEPPEHSQVGATPEDRDEEKLILSTIHSAKGLEWHTVFVLSLIDGFIPYSKALHSLEETEEERRLLYVACTRAQQNLYLLCPEFNRPRGFSPMGSGFAFSMPSRFLGEISDFNELTEEWQIVPESEEKDTELDW